MKIIKSLLKIIIKMAILTGIIILPFIILELMEKNVIVAGIMIIISIIITFKEI